MLSVEKAYEQSMNNRYVFVDSTNQSFIQSLTIPQRIRIISNFNQKLNLLTTAFEPYTKESIQLFDSIDKQKVCSNLNLESSEYLGSLSQEQRKSSTRLGLEESSKLQRKSSNVGDSLELRENLISSTIETDLDRNPKTIKLSQVFNFLNDKFQPSWIPLGAEGSSASRHLDWVSKTSSSISALQALSSTHRQSSSLIENEHNISESHNICNDSVGKKEDPIDHIDESTMESFSFEEFLKMINISNSKVESMQPSSQELHNEMNMLSITDDSNQTKASEVSKPKRGRPSKDYSDDRNVIVVDGKIKFRCLNCSKTYSKKIDLVKHLKNKTKCEEERIYKEAAQAKMVQQTFIDKSVHNTVHNSVHNNTNINNTQNIQNNSENKLTCKVRDFFEQPYSYDHITDDIFEDKEFFLIKNFCTKLFENDENKNIYFDKEYAFLYAGASVKRVPADKAGFVLLEKAEKAIKFFLWSHDKLKLSKDEVEKIIKFWGVSRNKYKHDTVARVYDPITHTYSPAETNTCRTRDKILSDLASALGIHKERVMEIFHMMGLDKQEIDTFYKISIDDYESSRKRGKQFIDDPRQYR